MESTRDKLEKLKVEINELLDKNGAFIHWDSARGQIVLEDNYVSVSVPIDYSEETK